MHLLAIDPGSRMAGFAHNPDGGDVPSVWSAKMRAAGEPFDVAVVRMGFALRDLFRSDGWPELIAVEQAMHPAVSKSAHATIALQQIEGAIRTMCGQFSRRLVVVPANEVRHHFIGAKSMGNRDATNAAVLQRAMLLGYLPRGSGDIDAANAAAIWDWAMATHGGRLPRELVMFGERAS